MAGPRLRPRATLAVLKLLECDGASITIWSCKEAGGSSLGLSYSARWETKPSPMLYTVYCTVQCDYCSTEYIMYAVVTSTSRSTYWYYSTAQHVLYIDYLVEYRYYSIVV